MEFKALQAQINPHFLFNTLNHIRWLADIQRADNVRQLVSSLLALLHGSMGKGGEHTTMREEIEHLKHYLEIQEFRYYDKFETFFDIDRRIEDAVILKFLLQPIVENALIHGIAPLQGKGLVTIKGYLEGEDLILQVTDNGVGIPEEKLERILDPVEEKSRSRFSGIGLRNVSERIRLHYGSPYGLTVSSLRDLYTTVTVRLPYRPETEE
jgi:two-component system sensor histidine kinase YesM